MSQKRDTNPSALPERPNVTGVMSAEAERLYDKERVATEVLKPTMSLLTVEEMFNEDGTVDILVLKEHLKREGRITWEALNKLFDSVEVIFREEPNCLNLNKDLSVCGDIHGQFFDLIRLFEMGGQLPQENYLFLGDYVDRGSFSIEVVILLFSLKLTYPDHIWLLRGNHECRRMTRFFNFKDECLYKYDLKVYDKVMTIFDALPLAAVLNKRYFCVHAGLSPDVRSVKDIDKIYRFQEIPREGPLCDLLWSDPAEENPETGGPTQAKWFRYNAKRGISFVYGKNAVKVFLKSNGFHTIIRGHTVQVPGFALHFQSAENHIPKVITVFSAPDYCDMYRNQGALIKLRNKIGRHGETTKSMIDILTFNSSPHPYYLPNFRDIFSWSLPFVNEKVKNILQAILEKSREVLNSENPETDLHPQRSVIVNRRVASLKQKIRSVGKLMLIMKKLRKEKTQVNLLKSLSASGKMPVGILSQGHDAMEERIAEFIKVQEKDMANESIGEDFDPVMSRKRYESSTEITYNPNFTAEFARLYDSVDEAEEDESVQLNIQKTKLKKQIPPE